MSVHAGWRIQRGSHQPTFVAVALCVYAGGASVLQVAVFVRVKGAVLGELSLRWVVASRHDRVNCRRCLAEQFFWSGHVCRWAFVSRVPPASTRLGSKIVCSIDEKVA